MKHLTFPPQPLRDFVEQTTTGAFLGTIRYAAPEYLFGESYDHTIDIYSFGAIAYELLVGRQHYSKYRHWARVVAAKLAGVQRLQAPELDRIAKRSTLGIARFAREVIDHSRCVLAGRDLDLSAFIAAADGRLWCLGLPFDGGALSPYEPGFEDRFGSPEVAADFVKRELPPEYLEPLRNILLKVVWRGYIGGRKIDTWLFSELRRRSIIKEKQRSRTLVRFPPSLVEAVFRGLL